MIEPLLLKLGSHDILSDDEVKLLELIVGRERTVAAGEDVVSEGSRPNFSTLLVDGFAARYKVLEDGTRQITALQVPGDFVDLHAFPLKVMDHGILAMSSCRVALVDHADLKTITETNPHLTRLLWLDTLVDGAVHREWIVAMGRRSKRAHIAHLICELYVRLRKVRRTNGASFQFPLTQTAMADVLGVSLVHLNKTLQSLRKERAFTWEGRVITILDWAKLQSIAGFDPGYLALSIEPR
ncbi:Crp/Fnr family transcriptional regulator [Rhizobium binxianense]